MSLPGHCGSPPVSRPAESLRPTASLRLGSGSGSRSGSGSGSGVSVPLPTMPKNPFSLVDLQARKVSYLRVSVTDRCNYRCSYCMPEAGVEVVPRDDLLTFAEIERLVRIFVSLGVRKVRLTGGEPLVRKDLVDLVQRLARIDGVQDLALTTNGHLLAPLAKPLRDAGLHRLNVSLDTLDPVRFAHVTRRGSLDAVLAGLQAAADAGFRNTKINAVMLRGLNDDEVGALCDFAGVGGHILRYIEYMPIGVDAFWGPETYLPAASIREKLGQTHDLVPDPGHPHPGGGPAVYWTARPRHGGGPTVPVGFIAAVSEKFCALCNRIRLSPTGTLRECLSTAGTLSLRDRLRAGQDDAALADAITASMQGKVDGHRFEQAVTTYESMSAIGG